MRIEERLHAFFETLQDELQSVTTDSLPMRFAIKRQMERARKRALFHKPDLQDKAVKDFKILNDFVGNREITLDAQLIRDAKYFLTVVLERYTTSLNEENIQLSLDTVELFSLWRFGPGASYGIKGSHAAEKIEQPMTCSARVEPLVRKLRRDNVYFARFDCERETPGTSVVRGSKLATVPKNEDVMRTIAIEPSGNMVLQLAAGRYLEGALRSIGLDISTQQDKNKLAACRGSMTNGLATIDLKSASDMIKIDLVRALLPRRWSNLLETLRSEEIELPDGSWMKLNMISTMGNGFTFPLMTLIICSLIYAFRAQRGGPNLFIDWSDTCVFGDDIIVPSHEYHGISDILEAAGLVVNSDKSYHDGPFRESCGGDFYEGVNVTPFYVKALDNPPDIYVAINQVVEWYLRSGVLLHRTLGLLKSYLDGKVLFVPEWHNPDQGVLTQLVDRRYKYLSAHLHRVRLKDSPFAMMLAVGGFVTSGSDTDLFYSPRVNRPKWRVRDSRLPKGYLDGWCAGKRTRRQSDLAAMVIAAILA